MSDQKYDTVEEKLDLILDRCKKNLSTIDDLKEDWVRICRLVAHNNTDTGCPLFRTYIYHLEVVDKLIFRDETQDSDEPYRATATGLMFNGYEATKLQREADTIHRHQAAERMESYQKSLVSWTQALTYGTWAAAIGAIGMVVWEVRHLLKHLYYHAF